MKPETEALAFRIWQYANPLEWNVTIPDISEALMEPLKRIERVLTLKGWMIRVRRVGPGSSFVNGYYDSVSMLHASASATWGAFPKLSHGDSDDV